MPRTQQCLILLVALNAVVLTSATAGTNLLVNGDAETEDLTGWTDASGNGFDVWGGSEGSPVFEGAFTFWGGQFGTGTWQSEIHQDVDVSSLASEIDSGSAEALFTGVGRTNADATLSDDARIVVEYRSQDGTVLDSFDTGVIQPFNEWVEVSDDRCGRCSGRTIRRLGSKGSRMFPALSIPREDGDAGRAG